MGLMTFFTGRFKGSGKSCKGRPQYGCLTILHIHQWYWLHYTTLYYTTCPNIFFFNPYWNCKVTSLIWIFGTKILSGKPAGLVKSHKNGWVSGFAKYELEIWGSVLGKIWSWPTNVILRLYAIILMQQVDFQRIRVPKHFRKLLKSNSKAHIGSLNLRALNITYIMLKNNK